MRFNCDKWRRLSAARRDSLYDWHRWFAWHPVTDIGTPISNYGGYVWLETIERRKVNGERHENYLEYRECVD